MAGQPTGLLFSGLQCRGFVDGTDKVQFTTDFRSQKVEEMKHCPFGEVF
jgi:hypothetical protein